MVVTITMRQARRAALCWLGRRFDGGGCHGAHRVVVSGERCGNRLHPDVVRGAGCPAAGELKYGKPTEQILLSAIELNADLIVVGHRDQGTLARWLNGSVGESILHQPPCSLLIAVKSEHRVSNVTSTQQQKVQGKR